MFKFIHAADLHLDAPLRGLQPYGAIPADAIRAASRLALENLVELAKEEEVALVVIAGDLWDSDWKDHNSGLYFAGQMGKLRGAGVQVVIVTGNHDAGSQITKALRLPENVRLLSGKHPEVVRFDAFDAAVVGQSFAAKSVSANLAAGFPRAEPALFTIGLLHTSLDGRENHDPYAPCTVAELQGKGYAYWALGHAHLREVVCEAPWIVFSGTIQGRHAREPGPKGCTLVTVENREVQSVTHHDIDVVRWSDCRVDLSRAENGERVLDSVREALERELREADGRLLAVRIRLAGATKAHRELSGRPERWRHEVRSLGADISPAGLWVEKIFFETKPAEERSLSVEQDDAIAELLGSVEGIEASPHVLEQYGTHFQDLKTKLPNDLYDPATEPAPWEPERLRSTFERAKHILATRLLGAGRAR
ncbi:MAG: DNA repair exonuclease [Deltaproteobacteria bacterium]|nr:DNA repair exonuclease [Deltaproteobacteria bacterium]